MTDFSLACGQTNLAGVMRPCGGIESVLGDERDDGEASRHEPENIVATTIQLSSHGMGQQVHHTLAQRNRRMGPERAAVDDKEQGRCRIRHRDRERRRDHG